MYTLCIFVVYGSSTSFSASFPFKGHCNNTFAAMLGRYLLLVLRQQILYGHKFVHFEVSTVFSSFTCGTYLYKVHEELYNYFYGIYTAAKDSLEQQIQSSLTFSRFINRFHAYVIIIAISSQSYTPFPKKPVLHHV